MLSLRPSDKLSVIWMQINPSFIAILVSLPSFFDQFNFAFQCFLLNAGFLAAMPSLSSGCQKTRLMVSTDFKLDKTLSLIFLTAVFIG